MILPRSEFSNAHKKAKELLDDPRTQVLAAGKYGCTLKSADGVTLSIFFALGQWQAAIEFPAAKAVKA